jgi:triosephosphate isomerase
MLIAGNWKMYKNLAEARELVAGIREGLPAALAGGAGRVEVLICPPAQLLFPMAKAVAGSGILLGAQNAHEESQGAFTGEISVPMIADTGATHVIIGHSERRQLFGEGGDRLAKKVTAALQGGLKVVYCVGETLEEREAGKTEATAAAQLDDGLRGAAEVFGPGRLDPARFVIAYEPVWAIGTGRTASPEQAQEVHHFLRGRLAGRCQAAEMKSLRILYGGSVKPGNAAGLLGQADIDGALVGGACLAAADFLAIIGAAASAPSKA